MEKSLFEKRLTESANLLGNSICLGIDPHFKSEVPQFFKQEMSRISIQEFLLNFSYSCIDAARGLVPIVKFQSALFEQYGSEGIAALEKGVSYARAKSVLTILDAKRCDISTTMQAYGTYAFEYCQADALTIIGYMGSDTLNALIPWMHQGKFIYLVLYSSNLSGQTLQQKVLGEVTTVPANKISTSAAALFDHFITFCRKNNISNSLGFVIGAEYFTQKKYFTLLEQFSKSLLLIPGFGAQGLNYSDVAAELKHLLKKDTYVTSQSRSLLGIGLKKLDNKIEGVKSWQDYSSYVASNIKKQIQIFKSVVNLQ
ncbi:MAG: orotidine-5'-phosphate decarboxylase [Oligoflexales bacterium]|nr:orotidine-5'-phosphate decarboxylase [Oligoflexales bacterium]